MHVVVVGAMYCPSLMSPVICCFCAPYVVCDVVRGDAGALRSARPIAWSSYASRPSPPDPAFPFCWVWQSSPAGRFWFEVFRDHTPFRFHWRFPSWTLLGFPVDSLS